MELTKEEVQELKRLLYVAITYEATTMNKFGVNNALAFINKIEEYAILQDKGNGNTVESV